MKMGASNHQTNHHKSVYVVEDDIELSTIMDRVLKSIDDQVVLNWSTTAEEAMENIHNAWEKKIRRPYDLIIVDVFLDGTQNGIDLWNLCRREYPDIPVVLTSATRLGKLFPANAELPDTPIFLQKPFNINESKKLFKSLLNYPEYQGNKKNDANGLVPQA
jgi:response regulator of citrate/malate metabolism